MQVWEGQQHPPILAHHRHTTTPPFASSKLVLLHALEPPLGACVHSLERDGGMRCSKGACNMHAW